MMYWTRSTPADFAEILAALERLEIREQDKPAPSAHRSSGQEDGAAPPASRLRQVLSGWPWWTTRAGSASGSRVAAAYAETQAERQSREEVAPPAPPRAPATEPPRSENEMIAAELGLTRTLAPAELRQLRRDFAMRNHPDRCAPAQRRRAARRMTIANMLIDAALKQKHRPE
jgi:hypothetical protein